jgi:Fic family protein
MRKYERTHPWINFQVNLKTISFPTWMLLGEAQSKCQHITGVPLPPVVNQRLHSLYLAKGVQATTAIEGNTLNEEEVQKILAKELQLPASREYLQKEVENIISAMNGLLGEVTTCDKYIFTVGKIKTFNRLVLKGLELEEGVVPGRIRGYSVVAGTYKGVPAEDCEYLLSRLCEWLNQTDFLPAKGNGIARGILKAILAHLYLAWIHPFGDGNGRTARLMEFIIMLDAGIPAPAAHLLSNHYNMTRSEYYRQLSYSSKAKPGDDSDFIHYALQGLVDGLQVQITLIKSLQHEIIWRDIVFEKFKGRNKPSDIRCRDLILEMSSKPSEIRTETIRELSPAIALYYAGKSDKTIHRDIKILLEMALLKQDKNTGLISINKELIQGFMPLCKRDD